MCTYRNVKTFCILRWNPSDITSDLSTVCPLYTSLVEDWQATHLSILVADKNYGQMNKYNFGISQQNTKQEKGDLTAEMEDSMMFIS